MTYVMKHTGALTFISFSFQNIIISHRRTSQKVKYSIYYEIQASHKPAIDQLKSLVPGLLSEGTEAKQEEVKSFILSIEALELRKIMDKLDICIENYVTSAIKSQA